MTMALLSSSSVKHALCSCLTERLNGPQDPTRVSQVTPKITLLFNVHALPHISALQITMLRPPIALWSGCFKTLRTLPGTLYATRTYTGRSTNCADAPELATSRTLRQQLGRIPRLTSILIFASPTSTKLAGILLYKLLRPSADGIRSIARQCHNVAISD